MNFLDFACLNGSCKFCTAQGEKVYVRVVEILLVEGNGIVYSVAFKKPPGRVDLMPLKIFFGSILVTIQYTL